ncbi:hypothetical protein C8R48DRAFT_768082 [Suillus tomentosus]|nr:hypothetical protein C8R48DRAFT_768082 [Suillus tomentosus]
MEDGSHISKHLRFMVLDTSFDVLTDTESTTPEILTGSLDSEGFESNQSDVTDDNRFLEDINVQDIDTPTKMQQEDKIMDVGAFFGAPYATKSKDRKACSVRDCKTCHKKGLPHQIGKEKTVDLDPNNLMNNDAPHTTEMGVEIIWFEQTYSTIQKYRQLSGVHWDNVRGADIEGEAETAVWNEYISRKGNSGMYSFHVSGWRHYEQIDSIIPQGSGMRGCTGYQPHTALPPPLRSDSSTDVPAAENNASPSTAPAASALTIPTSQGSISVSSTNTVSTSITSSAKCSHSDMVHDSTTSFPSASVSMPHKESGTQMLPPPSESGSMKKPKTTLGHTQARSIGTKNTKTSGTKMLKTTIASAWSIPRIG